MKIKLSALRVNAGLTQSEAAEIIGVTKTTIHKWERYETFPTAPQLVALCGAYKCRMDDIFLPDTLAKSEER